MLCVSYRSAVRFAVAAALCAGGAACSSSPSGDSGLFSKPSSFFATPDWMRETGTKEAALWRPVSPEDLAGADGRCAGAGTEAATAPDATGDPAAAAAPTVAAGIGLGMSECEVIRRAGPADNFELGSNEQSERTVTMTYLRGNRPGIYRFRSGRLASIERAPEPPAPPKVAKPKPKPKPRTAAAPRPTQPAAPQAAPAAPRPAAAPWPAPQPARPAAPWPSPQPAQPQAAPWPAPSR